MKTAPNALPRDFGDYELIAELGTGSQGAVYLAQLRRHAGLGPRVAIKTLPPEAVAGDPVRLQAFVREGRIGTLLRHPNLVRVLDVGRVEERPFVALELVDGCSALELVRKSGVLGDQAWLELAQQAALGLAALHDAGEAGAVSTQLLHLDLKPANLLVDRAGCVKLADYGLSQLTGAARNRGADGTPGYMPREQLKKKTLDGRSDLFALAVTLHNLRTGQRLLVSRPLSAFEEALEGLDARLEDPETWAAFLPGLAGAVPILAQCLRRDPAARMPDAHALWAALSRIELGADPGSPLRARVEQALGPAPRPLRPPPPSRPFVGREHDGVQIRRAVARWPVCWVVGVSGIGKSTLVRHALPGAVWVSAHEAGEPANLQRRVLRALGHAEEADLTQLLPLLPARTLVIDGLDPAGSPALVAAVAAWSAAAAEMRWVVTAAAPPVGAPAGSVRVLGPLSLPAAAQLVRRYAPELPPAEAEALAGAVSRRPATLELLGRAVAGGATPSEALEAVDRVHTSAETTRWLWSQLSEGHKALLAELAEFRGPFSLSHAEALTDRDPARLGDAVDALCHQGLLEPSGTHFALAPRVRSELVWLREQVLSERDERALSLRHAVVMSRLGEPERLQRLHGPRSAEAFDTVVAAVPDLRAAVDAALGVGAGTTAARCLQALLLASQAGRCQGPDAEQVSFVLVDPSLDPGERVRLALAAASRSHGKHQRIEALCRQALAEAKALEDEALLGEAHIVLGGALVTRDALDEAGRHLEAGLALAQRRGDRRQQVRALRQLARHRGRVGRYTDADACIGSALDLARGLQTPSGVAVLQGLRGLMWARRDRSSAAVPVLQEAAEQLEVAGWWSQAATAWSNVAFAVQTRDVDTAMNALSRASRLLLQSGSAEDAASLRLNTVSMLFEVGRREEAVAEVAALRKTAAELGSVDLLRSLVANQLGVATEERDWDALEALLSESEQIGMTEVRGWYTVLVTYCGAHLALGRGHRPAVVAALETLAVHCETGDFASKRWMLDEIRARLAALDGDVPRAVAGLEQAFAGVLPTEPTVACEMVDALVELLLAAGDRPRAVAWLERARREIAPQLHASSGGRQWIAAAHTRIRDHDAAGRG